MRRLPFADSLRNAFGRRSTSAFVPGRQDGLAGSVPCAAEALEERVLFALALASGGSGYSANLSTNPVTREYQLTCDPAVPKAGSTSVTYDPKVVHLTGFVAAQGYNNLGFIGYVEVLPPGATKSVLQPLVA